MKLITPFLSLALAIILLTSCEKLENLLRFDFSDAIEITIPSQTIISGIPIKINTPPVTTNSQQAFANNKTEAKYVKEARLKQLKLTIIAPDNQNFNFLNKIHIFISADNQPEVLLAYKNSVPVGVTSFNLDVTNENLKPYIQGNSYSIRTEAVVDEATTREIKLKADMTFSVTADAF